LVHVNIGDTETIAGTISGTTVTVVTRAVEAIGAYSTAQNHTAGDSVKLIFSYAAAKNMFSTKIDEQSPTGTTFAFLNPLPTGYRNLRIEWQARGDTAAASTQIWLRFNGDAAGNYDFQSIEGSGATAAAGEGLAQLAIIIGEMPAGTSTAAYGGGGTVIVPNYAGAVFNKVAVANFGMFTANTTGTGSSKQRIGKWRTTATAITRLDVSAQAGSFVTGSIFTLYGDP
jgi:hypothetical protein